MTRTQTAWAISAILLLPAGAAAQDRVELQLTADVRILSEQVAKLQLSVNQLAEQVAAAGKRLDEQTAAAQKTAADQQLALTALASDVATIRQNLSVTATQVQQLAQELPGLRTGLGLLTEQMRTLVNLLQPGADPSGAASAAGAPAPGAAPGALGPLTMPESPAVIFNAARNDYMSGRYQNAVDGFREFVDKFPTAPQAAEAHFEMGRSLRALKKPREALAAFTKVVEGYKDSAQVADAYYEQGMCYQELNQRAEARRIFQLLTTDPKYKDSSAALLAAQQLRTSGAGR
jgi:tol-pal system protein YbgF